MGEGITTLPKDTQPTPLIHTPVDPTGRVDIFLTQLGERMFGTSNPELWDKYKSLYVEGVNAIAPTTPLHPTTLKGLELGVELISKALNVSKR